MQQRKLRVVSVTDLHGDAKYVDAILSNAGPVDVFLFTGDLTQFGGTADAEEVLAAARERVEYVWAVAGNCDLPEVNDWLEEEGLSLDGRHEVVSGVAFLGVGRSLPCPGRTPNEISQDELFEHILEEALEGVGPGTPLVLATHQPPWGTVTDRAFQGRQVGSQAIRRFIEKRKPLACFCGHIHEGQGTDRIGPTLVANPGPLREGKFVWAEIEEGQIQVRIRSVREAAG